MEYSQLEWTEQPELNSEVIWKILNEEITDIQVNQLAWYYLGYRYDLAHNLWDLSQVDPIWKNEYPEPPDFIENRPPTVRLTRSIPPENKQLLKTKLRFTGYKLGEFGPRQTRRATVANWLLSYLEIRSHIRDKVD